MLKKYGKRAKISLIMMILFVVISAFNTVNADLLGDMEGDAEAFTFVNDGKLFTNIGKNKIYCYNINTKKIFSYNRSASIPQKSG